VLVVLLLSAAPASGAAARLIARGETQHWTLAAAAGQQIELDVDAIDVELEISAVSPLGAIVVRGTTKFSRRLSFLANDAGTYRIVVHAPPRTTSCGRYELALNAGRGFSPPPALAAQRDFLTAVDLLGEQKAAATRSAITRFESSLKVWRELGDVRREADTLHALGIAHSRLTQHREAIAQHERALTIRRELGDLAGEAASLEAIGFAHEAISDLAKAREAFEPALALSRRLGSRTGEARQLTGLGAVLQRSGKIKESFEALDAAQRINRQLDDRAAEVMTLRWIGNAWMAAGERGKSRDISEQALALAKQLGDRAETGLLLNNIAVVLGYENQWQRAIELFDQAAALYAEGGQQAEEAAALINIGVGWGSLGEHRKAIGYFERALPISRSLGDRGREVFILTYLGIAHAEAAEPDPALKYLAAGLELSRKLKLTRVEALALNHIAKMNQAAGQHAEALENYGAVRRIWREVGNTRGEAHVLVNVGSVLGSMGRCAEARTSFNEAIAVSRQIEDRVSEGAALWRLAQLDRDEGQLFDAYERAQAAVAIAEAFRSRSTAQQFRAAFLATARDQYELQIDILMRMHERAPAAGFDVLALQASERARARGLVETLEEAQAQIRHHADPALVARELQVRQLLNDKAVAQTRLLSSRPKAEQAAALAREIEELTEELHQVEGRIRASSPRYGALFDPGTLTLAQIRQLLDEETMLLEFSLGMHRSHAWAVTLDSLRTYALPPRATIDALARRVHMLASSRAASPAERRRIDREYETAATELSTMLLGPLASELRGKRLVIAAEGALQYIPFAALPLAADHEIAIIPSAATLEILRRDPARAVPEKTLMIFADPVFSHSDPRVRAAQDASRGGSARMPRLPLTRLEAASISRLVPTTSITTALDFHASRATAMGEDLRRHRIVHFATHGLVDSVHPELSGVVLSLVDERGRAQDGFLRLHDIYNLELDADLVVLSACQTALGKEIRGEGIVGLTRGFMHAGVPRVVASLWKVDDRATAELMRRFYEGMLGSRRLRPAAALRAAQVEMASSAMWARPYYWAGFVLQGEWR
jgi:CHAT domain-containing protein